MSIPCPCNGCTERFGGCHSKCPKEPQGYNSWKFQMEQARKAEEEWCKKHRVRFSQAYDFNGQKIYGGDLGNG